MASYTFRKKKAFSLADRQGFDINIIKHHFNGCVNVVKTDLKMDRTGVDYIATLDKGAEIYIDAKARERGASRFWSGEPELALEIWSVIPDGQQEGKQGWTLSESTLVDYILYTFDASDSEQYYILPFQLLRKAFIHRFWLWKQQYGSWTQNSVRWRSESMFVPASVVIQAVSEEMMGVA